MAGINQKMKAVITFGGNIDSSWGRSTAGLNKGLAAVSRQSGRLATQQKKLRDNILKARSEGKSISSLKVEYDRVTRAIGRASREQAELNRRLQQSERLARRRARWGSAMRGARTFAGGALVGGGLMSAGLLAGIIGQNRKTAGKADRAGSYGVDIETYNAWAALSGQTGLSGPESIGDMFLKYRKSAGKYQSGNRVPVLEKAFSALGFGQGDMAGLDDIGQLNKIMSRALSMKDQTKASFAVNSLLGPDAAKLLSTARAMGKSWDEIIREQKSYNLITQTGADGAARNALALDKLSEVLSSSIEEVAGQLGATLAPKIEVISQRLAGWLKDGGIEKIAAFAKDTLLPAAFKFAAGLVFVGKVAFALAKKLAWLIPDAREDKSAVLRTLGRMGPDIARNTAEKKGLGDWFDEQMAQNPALRDDARAAHIRSDKWNGFDNAEFDERMAPYLSGDEEKDPLSDALALLTEQFSQGLPEGVPGVTDNRNQTVNMTVNAQPGQDATAVAEEAVLAINRQGVFNGNNAMLDTAEVW